MHASARDWTRGAQASANRRMRSAAAPTAQQSLDIVGCRIRQLERARRQRRYPIVRQRPARGPAHAWAPVSVITCCCCRRRCGPKAFPHSSARQAPRGLRRALRCGRPTSFSMSRELGTVADLRAVDAQRQLGRDPAGRSRQRNSLDAASLGADCRRASRRAPAACRDHREGRVGIGRGHPSRRARWTASGCGFSGRPGCATCK